MAEKPKKRRIKRNRIEKKTSEKSSSTKRSLHPKNPLRWGEPACLWEILRRCPAFQQRVRKISKKLRLLRKSSQKKQRSSESNTLRFNKLYALKQEVDAEKFWAKTALKWLLPEPVFHYSFKNGDSGVGIEPEVGKLKIQKEGEPCTDGYIHRFGPDIYMDEAGRDNFQIWRRFKEEHGEFSTDLHWSETPVMFQEDFAAAWLEVFPRNLENLQALREPHRTDFFEKFDACKTFPWDGKSGSVDQQMLFKFRFEMISQDYHVFLFPKVGKFKKTEITEAFMEFAKEVSSAQNITQKSLLGDYLPWEFLCRLEDALEEQRLGTEEIESQRRGYVRSKTDDFVESRMELLKVIHSEIVEEKLGVDELSLDLEHTSKTSNSFHSRLAMFEKLDDPERGGGLIQKAYPLAEFLEIL